MSRKQLCLPPGNKTVVRKLRGSSSLDELLVCWALLQLKAAGSEYRVWDAGRVTDTQYLLTHQLFLQGRIVESSRCFLWRRPPGFQLLPFPRICSNSPLPPHTPSTNTSSSSVTYAADGALLTARFGSQSCRTAECHSFFWSSRRVSAAHSTCPLPALTPFCRSI